MKENGSNKVEERLVELTPAIYSTIPPHPRCELCGCLLPLIRYAYFFVCITIRVCFRFASPTQKQSWSWRLRTRAEVTFALKNVLWLRQDGSVYHSLVYCGGSGAQGADRKE